MKSLTEEQNQQKSVKLNDIDAESSHENNNINSHSQINRARTWNQKELYAIAAFFYYNCEKFQSQNLKKKWKIYKAMSLFVETRNINQCRTYTYKLLKNLGKSDRINAFFKASLPFYDTVIPTFHHVNNKIFQQIGSSQSDQASTPFQIQKQIDQKKNTNPIKIEQETQKQMGHWTINIQDGEERQLEINNWCQQWRRWMECHRYFLEWSWRINQLVTLNCMQA